MYNKVFLSTTFPHCPAMKFAQLFLLFFYLLHFILYRNVPRFCNCVMVVVELLISCVLFFHLYISIDWSSLFCSLLVSLSFNRICISLCPAIRVHLPFLISVPQHMKLQKPLNELFLWVVQSATQYDHLYCDTFMYGVSDLLEVCEYLPKIF